jgi:dGTPase
VAGHLAHLKFPVEQARGRRYPELPHPYRNEFQRDRDRIVHARAFRRLENKTQVFTPGLSDHFRNRLTHTIEVSQIARTVAGVLGLDEDLTEALSLAHDIGHPPFAHAGEEELDRIMKRYGERFEHNLHALRIVESFENPYAMFPGLNLTFEVREGIIKHSRDFNSGEIPDADEYLPGLKPPLEAQLIDLCDEIAYNTADLDDGYFARLISLEDAREHVAKIGEMDEVLSQQYPAATERVRMHEIVRALINTMVSGLIDGTIEAAKGLANVDDVRRNPSRVACFTPEVSAIRNELKNFLKRTVYQSKRLTEDRSRTTGLIPRLFEFFMEHPNRLPVSYLEESSGEPLHRIVCDYIAGMTDGFLFRTSEQMKLL